MRRSSLWVALCVVALVVAPLAAQFLTPAQVAQAEPSAPAALWHDEIVTLRIDGQIVVKDLYPQSGMVPADWNSGTDIGWQYIAAGDFNGDGDQELVAIGGNRIKVFDPFVQPTRTAVQFERTLDGGRVFRLIATGDFDGDGKDEIATTSTEYTDGVVESLRIYDGGADGNTWSQIKQYTYSAPWQALASGDFNADGGDDLAMMRNPVGNSPWLTVYNGRDWTTVAEGAFSYPWITMAAGKLSSASTPDQLTLLRTGVGANLDSLLMFNVGTGGFSDAFPGLYGSYGFYPNFTSLALARLTGSAQDVIFLLRDPQEYNKTGLLMINPTNLPLRHIELALDCCGAQWNQVRTGDTTGDGLDEVVILRSDRFRIYTQPQIDNSYIDVPGSYRVQPVGSDWPVMVLANLDGLGIAAGPTLAVSPKSLSFSLDYGQVSSVLPLSITNSGTSGSIAWQAQVVGGSSWLRLDTTQGTTPGQVNASVATNITPGVYTETIRITATDPTVKESPQNISVTYTLRGSGLLVTPTSLSFNVPWGEQATQNLTVSGGGSSLIHWTAQVLEGSSWLRIGSTSGTTPSPLSVQVDSVTAGPGTYQGTIKITAVESGVANSPTFVSVSLTVPDPGFVVSPKKLQIWQQIGGPLVTQQVKLLRPSSPTPWVATALPLTAAADLAEKLASGQAIVGANGLVVDGVLVPPPAWLSFTPDSGSTPATISVSAPTTTAGAYKAIILIVAQDSTVATPVQAVEVTAIVAPHIYQNFLSLMMGN